MLQVVPKPNRKKRSFCFLPFDTPTLYFFLDIFSHVGFILCGVFIWHLNSQLQTGFQGKTELSVSDFPVYFSFSYRYNFIVERTGKDIL